MATKEQVAAILRDPKVIVVATTALAFVAGAVAGGSYVHNQLIKDMEDTIEQEVDKARVFYENKSARLNKEGEFATPGDALLALGHDPIETSLFTDPDTVILNKKTVEVVETREHNIFTNPAPEWNYPEELAKRTEDKPYIVSKDEHLEGDAGYEPITLTFYEEDRVLADQQDMPVPDINEFVGVENVDRFGYGSEDPTVVYIRNDRLEMDFEILKHEGSFSRDVLGLDDEGDGPHLSHGSRRAFRRGEDT